MTELQTSELASLGAKEAEKALDALHRNPRLAIYWAVQDDWVTYRGQTVPDELWAKVRYELLSNAIGDGAFPEDFSEFLADNEIMERGNWEPEPAEDEEE